MSDIIQNYYEWSSVINETYTIIEGWYNNLYKLKSYIDIYSVLPSIYNKDEDIKYIGRWALEQNKNYINKVNIMKNSEIFDKWSQFINEYELYFTCNNVKWYNNLTKLKQYINENNKLPSKHNKNKYIKYIGHWTLEQNKNYKNKVKTMKNPKIYYEWEGFINNNKYNKYFKNYIEKWYDKLNELKTYINENNKLPLTQSENKYIRSLGRWLSNQRYNYKKKIHSMEIPEIYNNWSQFINKYKYLKNN